MKWKVAFLIMLALFVFVNIFWFYKMIESGISLTYQEDSFDQCHNSLLITKKMLLKSIVGMDSRTFIQQVNDLKDSGHLILFKDNIVSIDDLKFLFKNDKLVEIQ
ncbi:MAG: hypothetical protein L3J79_03030 [Candidatus Marinimicrobia bacterium]|nr:hypothetical protein [Candidatus Neomarinimicrobiota bacterium]